MFVTRAMDGSAGGLQRMITTIMQALVARGHDICLLTWDGEGAESFFPMASRIRWHKLAMGDAKKKAGPGTMLRRAPAIRKIVGAEKPDLVVCFQGGAFKSMLLYTAGMNVPLVVAERTAPTLYEHANSARDRAIEHFAFRFARHILVQFDRYRTMYPRALRSNISTISNPVPEAEALARPAEPDANGRFTLLSAGRLGYQKHFGVLVEAFAALAETHPQWDLRIMGEGSERAKLEELIAASPVLAGRVTLPGATSEIGREYAAAHLFCLPSRWEGFPNALSEALAHGLPAVGFDGCAGVPDLIDPGKNGALAKGNGDAATLAAALSPLMADAEARARLGAGAVRSVAAYRPDRTFDRWERVLSGLAGA